MSKPRMALAGVAALSLITAGCVTDPNTGHKRVSRTAIGVGVGVAGGLLLGGLIGGGTGRLLGAMIGGVAGAGIGYSMDKQTHQLREKTEGTGVDVRPVDNGKAILVTLPDGVTFDSDSYMLKPEFRPTLDKIAENLTQNPDSLIDVYGHTDSTETQQHNQTLSENRARTVGDYLTTRGISASRIRTQGFGSSLPLASNDTFEGRARNRRVEIKIVPITRQQVEAARAAASGSQAPAQPAPGYTPPPASPPADTYPPATPAPSGRTYPPGY